MSSLEEQRLKKWLDVLGQSDPEMSKIAADKLGEIASPAATAALIDAMKRRTAAVAAACALALGKINDKSAIPDLIDVLKHHQEVTVQTAAAESLGLMKAVDAIPALKWVIDDYVRTYKNDRFNMTRGFRRGLFMTCIYSLRMIGTREARQIADHAERTEKEM